MTSKIYWTPLILLTICVSGGGCTQDLPLDPITTNESDWAPYIIVTQNDYQRIELKIDRPPRKELLRNIDSYHIELKSQNSTSFTPLDTITGTWFPASYINPQFSYYYHTKPGLSYNTDYSTRIAVKYRNGTTAYSNEYQFVTPPERGRVLRRISLSVEGLYAPTSIAFYKGSFYIINYEKLFRADTTTGQITLVKDNFRPPPEEWYFVNERTIAIAGDILFTFYLNQTSRMYTLVRLDLQTLRVDSSLKLSGSDRTLVSLAGYGSFVLLLWELGYGRQQITIFDPENGQTIQEFPATARKIEFPHALTCNEAGIWCAMNPWFANRISRLDPNNLSFLEVNRNPIFQSRSLTWDGANFWVIDQETRTLAKLKLEGF